MKISFSPLLLCTALLLTMGCGERDAPPETFQPEVMPEAMTPTPEVTSDSLHATLTGAAMVPGPGDPDGTGSAHVVLNPQESTVCFDLDVSNIDEPTAAHIHTGAAGESGPPVVNFDIGNLGLSGCVEASQEIISNIQAAPANYFVNVHNEEYGGGAIRGQLMR